MGEKQLAIGKTSCKSLITKGTKETQRDAKSKTKYKNEQKLQLISGLRKVKAASGLLDNQGKRVQRSGICGV
jgi:hypothetical protein